MSSLIISNFEAERFFVSERESVLPSVSTIYSRNNICSLDEMQFVFANSDHSLATQLKIDDTFRDYIEEIGYSFDNVYAYDNLKHFNTRISDNIFDTINSNDLLLYGIESVSENSFAIEEKTFVFAETNNLKLSAPDFNIIRMANSKVFSSEVADSMIVQDRYIVNSSDELSHYGEQTLLNNASLIIKSEFGVSGKGSVKIDTLKQLSFIVRFIKRQEEKGLVSTFIIERFLDKKSDFSAIAYITPDFKYQVLSLQAMVNSGNSFNSIVPVDKNTRQLILDKGYMLYLENALKCLTELGYFGSVCIDSMILKDNKVIPVVEINARKSMSFIYYSLLNKYNSIEGLYCAVSLRKLLIPKGFSLSGFIEDLYKNKLLFLPQNKFGVLLLNPNGLIVNSMVDEDPYYQANLYTALLYRNNDEREKLESKLLQFFDRYKIKIREQ